MLNIHVQEPLVSGNYSCPRVQQEKKSLIFTITFLSTLKWIVRMTKISEEKQEKLGKFADRNTCCGFAVSFFPIIPTFPNILDYFKWSLCAIAFVFCCKH